MLGIAHLPPVGEVVGLIVLVVVMTVGGRVIGVAPPGVTLAAFADVEQGAVTTGAGEAPSGRAVVGVVSTTIDEHGGQNGG